MTAAGEPIRVAHLCQRDDPKTGGALQVAALLVDKLVSVADIDAKLLFLYGPPGPMGEQFPTRCEYLGLTGSREVPRLGHRLLKSLRTVDVAHHHDMLTWSNLFSTLIPGVRRVMHGHVAAGVRSFGWRTRLANRVQTLRLSRFIAISEDVGESWKTAGVAADRVTVIGNAIDLERFRRREQERARLRNQLDIGDTDLVLGYVGRLHDVMKGTADFVRTLAQLPQQYVGFVIGDGSDRQAMERLADELGVGSRVRMIGAVEDPAGYYSAMDAFLFTSRFEHFGLTPMEAIAAGLPVFAFECEGGFREWAGDDLMFLAQDRDPIAMAQRIETAMASGQGSEKAASAMKVLTRRHSATAFVDRVAEVYREICGRSVAQANRTA